MANIKRRIAFTKGLPEELALRVHNVTDVVTDVATIDGSVPFDNKYVGANTFKTEAAKKFDVAKIVTDISTVGDTATDDESLVSAREVKKMKDLLDSLEGSIVLKGSFDIGTETVFPATAEIGWQYRIVNSVDSAVSVEIGGLDLTEGDALYKTASGWIKTDNTEKADILRDGDVSTNTDLAVDGTKLTDRATIKSVMAAAATKFINDSATVASDAITATYTPIDNVIFLGIASIANGDGTFDQVECSAVGKTITLAVDTTGEYDGKVATVTYAYVPVV